MLRVFALLALAGLVMTAVQAQVQPTPPPRTIAVTATGEQQVSPNLALVTLAVQTQASTVTQAVNQNNQIANRVIQAINQLNIPGLTIRTLDFDVQPIYEQPAPGRPVPNPPRIIAYQVINRVEVRIPAVAAQLASAVSRVIDAALDAGANRVDSVQLTLQEESPAVQAALAEATQRTRAMAQAMAQAAGVQLGRVLSLTASPYFQPPQPYPLLARAEAVSAPPIATGPLTLRVTVSAVYEIQ